jgi:LytS/YehU family sensor histidine kinase
VLVENTVVRVLKNADGSRTVVAGPIRIKLQSDATDEEIKEAARSVEEAWKEVKAATREAQAEVKAEIEAARSAEVEARQEADVLRREREALEREHEAVAKKSTRVITVNKPAGFNDLVMPLLTALLFAAILAKVLLNTRSKAAAKVAEAKQETERESLERQLVEAKLTTMQAQVEPHFLFNTLGSVEYLIEVDPKRAAEMQRSLIAYLRAAMPHMRDSTSNMGREAQLMQSYLEILAFRMEERLAFSVNVPTGLHSAEIPPMMLLSLVENCIKHGLEPKPEGGRVDVLAEIVDGRLRVTVADTGMGYKPDGAATSGTGVGLANIRERLQVLYKGAASIQIGSNLPSGTRVVIELPYKVTSNLKV